MKLAVGILLSVAGLAHIYSAIAPNLAWMIQLIEGVALVGAGKIIMAMWIIERRGP